MDIKDQKKPVEIFCCYAREDQPLLRELKKHLKLWEHRQLISLWTDTNISPGMNWRKEISRYLDSAHIILLLVSSNFLASDYCYSTEMTHAMERYERGEARVIPVILSSCFWEDAPFGELQALPTDAKPITSSEWHTQDEALTDVVRGLREVITAVAAKSRTEQSCSHALLEGPQLAPIKVGGVPDTAQEEEVRADPRIRLSLHNLPSFRNPSFTGRKELLAELRHQLDPGGQEGPRTQAINGLGGIGKTQVALEYAYRYQKDYSHIFWVTAATREKLNTDFSTLASDLGLPEKDEKHQSRVVAAVLRWLREHDKWLLILDNVEELSLVTPFMPSPGHRGAVLVTTQLETTDPTAHAHKLETMSPEDGALLLLRRTNRLAPKAPLTAASPDDYRQAYEISETLGGLPLALDQAGAYILETRRAIAEYLPLYKQRRKDLLARRGTVSTDHPPVETTFSLSFERIHRESPAAADLLLLCAFLVPDAIPETLITEGAAHLGPVLAPVVADHYAFAEVIEVLGRFSIIQRDPNRRELSLHRLVQMVLRDRMNEAEQQEWITRCIRLLYQALRVRSTGDVVMGFDYQEEQRHLEPHVQAIFALGTIPPTTTIDVASLFQQAVRYLYNLYRFDEAEPFAIRVLEILEQLLGPDHPDVIAQVEALAAVHFKQCRRSLHHGGYPKGVEAKALFTRALRMREQTLGPDHLDVADILECLADIDMMLYPYPGTEAESLYRRVLQIRLPILGPDDLDVKDYLEIFNKPDYLETLRNRARGGVNFFTWQWE